MSELLARILQNPEDFREQLPDLLSSTTPDGFSSKDWSLRHELPLHLINFLRDEAEPLLSLAQSSGATPGKTNRPAKYDYNSPLKPVLESPHKSRSHQSENVKKPKKKVKLFSGKLTGKTNKSFSEVEEQLEFRKNGIDGVEKLPTSPSKNKNHQDNIRHPHHSTSLFSVPEDGVEHMNGKKFNKSFAGRRNEFDTPSSGGNHQRMFKKKMSLSPNTLSLADFMAPIDRRNGKKGGKTPKSPSKIKSSTPIEDHVVPRVANNISLKISQLDLDSADSFPEIGEPSSSSSAGQKKRRMKPTLVSSSVDSGPVNPVFGQKVELNGHDKESESPFNVSEVEKKTFDRGEMVREIQSLSTPFKTSSAPVKTPSKTPSLSRSNSVVSTQLVVPSPLLVQKSAHLDLLAQLYTHIFNHNLMPNFFVELYFVIELLLLDVPQEYELKTRESSSVYLNTIHNCVYFSCQVLARTLEHLSHLDKTTIRLLSDNTRLTQFSPSLAEQLSEVYDKTCVPSPVMMSRVNKSIRAQDNNVSFLTVSFQSETDNRYTSLNI